MAEAESSHSLPAPTALVPASSEPTDEAEDCITVYLSPVRTTSDDRRPSRRSNLENTSSEIIDLSGSPPLAERSNGDKGRTSLLNSARVWLARVPSLFSPTMPVQAPTQPTKSAVADTIEPEFDDSASIRTATSASEHGEGEPVVLIEVPKRKRGRPRKSESLPSVLQARPRRLEDEDELLLSPETAVKRRREEEGDIAAAVERGELNPVGKRVSANLSLYACPGLLSATNAQQPQNRRRRSGRRATSFSQGQIGQGEAG